MFDSDYGFGARLLHRIALAMPMMAQSSFDIERALTTAKSSSDDRHVFITGLARAGTTILLRAIYETGIFRSLTYRDMPFILMPNIWKMLSKAFRRHQEVKERAHGDRIFVNADSPEAFEEVFWRTFCGKDYILADHLRPHNVDDETIDLFRQFVMLIVVSADLAGQTKYLSKNNNNILRLNTIKKAFPNAVIIIPFRDPVQQANSLLTQHLQFSERHKQDRFSYDYMRWLAHHEFGVAHKPFKFRSEKGLHDISHDPHNINYWLRIWCHSYEYVLATMPDDAILVPYERLCTEPANVLAQILEQSGITFQCSSLKTNFSEAKRIAINGVNEDLLNEALAIYKRMDEMRRSEI